MLAERTNRGRLSFAVIDAGEMCVLKREEAQGAISPA